jgi:hypothetical protein
VKNSETHFLAVRRRGGPKAVAAMLAAAMSLLTASALMIGPLGRSPLAAASAGPITRSDYNALKDPGLGDPYWFVQAKALDRVAYIPDPLGQRGRVQRVDLRPGDNGIYGSTAGERAEVIGPQELRGFVDGQTIVMSWSTLIDSSFASPPGTWNNFVQIHVGEGGGIAQSPWQLNLRGDDAQLRMRVYGGGRWGEPNQPQGSVPEWFDFGPLAKNVWHDFVAEIRFGCNGDGSARVWMDGRQLVDARDRKIGYCGDPGLYWKQGFYREVYDKPTLLWFGDTFRWNDLGDALAH